MSKTVVVFAVIREHSRDWGHPFTGDIRVWFLSKVTTVSNLRCPSFKIPRPNPSLRLHVVSETFLTLLVRIFDLLGSL